MTTFRVARVVWAVPHGRGWRGLVVDEEGVERAGVELPTLSPGVVWAVRGSRTVPVAVDGREPARAPPAGSGLELALAGGESVPELLARGADPACWWPGGDTMRGLSARTGPGPAGWPRVGAWTYCPHWEAQVAHAAALLPPVIRRAEPVYGEPHPPLVTPCPATAAELAFFGIECTLVFPDEPAPSTAPAGCVVVGLEDCTLANLVHLLEWADGAAAEVWHRWEPREAVPWRGEHSPPLALEVAAACCARAEDGRLLGEQVPPAPEEARAAAERGMPGPSDTGALAVGQTVYDARAGLFGVVAAIRGRERRAGVVYGSGPSRVTLRCGALTREVWSDVPWLVRADPPRLAYTSSEPATKHAAAPSASGT